MTHFYFVSYYVIVDGGSGFGNVEMKLGQPITSQKLIREIQDWIMTDRVKKGDKNPRITVLNYQFLRTE